MLQDRFQTFRLKVARYWSGGNGIKIAIVGLCLLATTSVYFAVSRAEQRLRDAVASEASVELASNIEQSFQSYQSLLKSVSYIAAVVPELDEVEFQKYIRNFELKKNYVGLFGVGWSAKISTSQSAANVAFQADLYTSADTAEDRQNDTHRILFIEPMNARNASAIGYNMFSEPIRRTAMLAASDTGSIVSSDAVILVQETDENPQQGTLLYAPVFKPGTDSGYDNLRGFVYGIVRIEDMIKKVLPRSLRQKADFALFDASSINGSPVFTASDFNYRASSRLISTPVQIPGKRWTLALDPASVKTKEGILPLSIYALAGGLILTGVLYLLTTSVYARRTDMQRSLRAAREQNRIRSVLVKELNHRVKNSLATVLSLASLSRRYADDVDSFYEGFSARVAALAGTHDILTRSDWHDASIHQIITAELGAHASVSDQRLTLDGPPIELKPSAALTLGLALHELGTNAAKYGALSIPEGSVLISWDFTKVGRKDVIELRWTEQGGPPVTKPTNEGFGTVLLTRLTARELGGLVDIDYASTGLRALITLDWEKTQAKDISDDLKS